MTEYSARIARVQQALLKTGIGALCVSVGSDLPYLTGYRATSLERITMLVVPAKGLPTLVVPGLEVPRVTTREESVLIKGWAESDDPIAMISQVLGDAGVVAIGDETWSRFLLLLQEAAPTRSFVAASDVMAPLRMTKSLAEIDALASAARTVDAVVDEMSSVRFSGRSERDVSREIMDRTIAGGHDTMDFWIVASGPNGASPHHEPGERIIEHGDAVVVDFGGHQNGYCSDTTRMFVVGDPPYGFDDAFEVLLSAHAAAVDAVRPGISAASVDAVARTIIDEWGYGGLFIHRVGHGIGMDPHESPYLVEGNDLIVQPGMVFSIEPGIYVPGEWGMRIEDIVAVTDDGVELLNRSDHAYRVVA